ncbi:MAG TPA: peptidase T [Syntrophomonadaceae bacterium]|nr:peptidase T [Syntrophomonadaceae bacterium]HPR92751.1 peptidase T [Syntrophomonadaceae bacterium]
MDTLLDRFLRYVKIDTQSAEDSAAHPSTPGQLELARLLEKELQELGLTNIRLSDKGYLMAELPANTDKDLPATGFIAHLDTSPDVSGKNVFPLLFHDYDGSDLILNEAEQLVIKAQDYPELKNYIGQTIITSDGTTLLGADDKAGVAAIMTVLAHLQNSPDIKHGKIAIAFTPDEEIGQGADHFDVEAFGADFAYTVDGGPLGELEYETFNAAIAHIDIKGVNVHPGTAYMRMQNALLIAMELNGMLPVNERPEFTRDHEGFYHLNKLEGSVEAAKMTYIIRDHDREKFEQKKAYLQSCVDFISEKYSGAGIKLHMRDQYYNMKEKIEPFFHIVTLAEQAMRENGIEPLISPVRGGTDGARLSFMGLPCPNIFTGGHNFHSRYEFIPLESMEKAVRVILKMIELVESQD